MNDKPVTSWECRYCSQDDPCVFIAVRMNRRPRVCIVSPSNTKRYDQWVLTSGTEGGKGEYPGEADEE